MAAPSQLSAGQQAKGNSSSSGAAWCIPDPTPASLLSLVYWKLLVKRVNALINMRAYSDPTRSDLQMSDANSVLAVAPGALGGGGGGTTGSILQMTINTLNGDYLTCTNSLGASGINVAKPTFLRFSQSSRTINGVTFSYGSYTGMQRSVTASIFAGTIIEYTEPEYQLGDTIYAANVDHTGVLVGGVELTVIDINVDQRGWVMGYGQ